MGFAGIDRGSVREIAGGAEAPILKRVDEIIGINREIRLGTGNLDCQESEYGRQKKAGFDLHSRK